MCGIVGALDTRDTKRRSQNACTLDMLGKIQHRGPDESCVTSVGSVSLGACRLSIVDPELGSQPIRSMCSQLQLVIAFNGEIYNFRTLRAALQEDHDFRSASDTEVILHAFEEFGVEAFSRLNGMFAFCITDGETSYLVRDRFGVKPLYYRCEGTRLLFASEARALLGHRAELHLEPTCTDFETIVGYETPFRGIFEVPPGTYLRYDAACGQHTLHSYYSLDQRQVEEISEQQAIEKMRWLITDAVRIRTDTELPFGCFVSGGIDSSIVAYLAQPDYLFSSIVTDRAYLNEEHYVNILRRNLGGWFVDVRLDPSQFGQYFIEMVQALDFPTTNLSAFTQFLLSKAVHEHELRIVLGGIGVDEYLGGYARHVAIVAPNREQLLQGGFKHYAPLFSKLAPLGESADLPDMYYALINRAGQPSEAGRSVVRDTFATQQSALNGLAATDLLISFPPLLRCDDRLNMHFSIESRSPFLDYRVVDFAFSLPDSFKIRQMDDSRVLTKYILRKAFEDIVPKTIVYREDKVGFPSPVALWLQTYFQEAVQHAYNVVSKVPGLAPLFPRQVLSDKSEFGRARWQMMQWAAWHLLFVEQLTVAQTTKALFGPAHAQQYAYAS
ncbi:MAG: asparagine synthase (glutamine-hydrolyzing) [Chloroflexota bacterium]|nr:asparagine synthase (glutamine-hydrolyzing) [Chloroflexota bacterium]